ncbi:MAG TPA: CcmD family protein [Terriglobales bacterium]|jgi:CcmD family protein|nr:CcmD family protein [Terriglobales bacterium]
MSYLYAAYIATWVIHIGYLTILVRRYARLKNEISQFKSRAEEHN